MKWVVSFTPKNKFDTGLKNVSAKELRTFSLFTFGGGPNGGGELRPA